MSDEKNQQEIAARIKGSNQKPEISLTMIGAIIALLVFIGTFVWINYLKPAGNAQKSLIPEANQTPEERRQGELLFGDVRGENPVVPEPEDDPRVTSLQAELAELRKQLDAMRDAATGQAVPPETATSRETFGASADELEKQRQTLDRLTDALKKESDEHERRHRELMARLRTTGGEGAQDRQETNSEDADRAARDAELERRREAEAARLASPIENGNTSKAASARENPAATGNAFLDRATGRTVETVYATRLNNVGRLVPQGTTIPALLETAITSDLPGQLRARVKRDVWSADATAILIPKGSTVIGEYSSDISIGQKRILVVWNRVITTDHRSVNIGSRGTDALGRAGMTGDIDHHFGLKFEAAFFVSLFSAIGNLASDSIAGGNAGSSKSDREGVNTSVSEGSDAISRTGKSTLDQYLSIPPSIHVDQGADINIFVSRDLYL